MISSCRHQRTISRAVWVEGFGYWSGRDVHMGFRPAPSNSGIVFVRADLQPPQRIPAVVANRFEIPRRTSLRWGAGRVEMVEHVLAALAGLHIDNCEVWVDAPEMPGCDGSSLAFVEVLEQAGIEEQDAWQRLLRIPSVTRVGDQRSWVEARPATTDQLTVECHIDYGPGSPIGYQTLALAVTPATFQSELAAARTFILEEEAEWLRRQGLGSRVTCHDLLVFDDRGPIDNPLRFPDECVRHKALDLVGDLALAGCDLAGHVTAHCSGHRLNAELVAALLAQVRAATPLRKTA